MNINKEKSAEMVKGMRNAHSTSTTPNILGKMAHHLKLESVRSKAWSETWHRENLSGFLQLFDPPSTPLASLSEEGQVLPSFYTHPLSTDSWNL